MVQIKLKSLHIQNFKGCKNRMISFGEKTEISGANATGKTTIFDAFLWVVADKDSSLATNFNVRKLDENGKPDGEGEISVESVLQVGEEEVSIKRVQKQKMTTKRGETSARLTGNTNDYFICGVWKQAKEFQEYIEKLINYDRFKNTKISCGKIFCILTNPIAFFKLLSTDEQRKVLSIISGFENTDAEIAEMFGDKYVELIPELKIGDSAELKKMHLKNKNKYLDEAKDKESRIDENYKKLVSVDIGSLEVEKAAKEAQLKLVEDELSGGNDRLEEINSKREEVMKLKFHLSDIQNMENQKLLENSREEREEVNAAEKSLADVKHKIAMLSDEINATHNRYEAQKVRTEQLSAEWKAEKAKTYPAMRPFKEFVPPKPLTKNDFICSLCGQELSEEKRNKKISEYEENLSRMRAEYDVEKAEYEADYSDRKKRFEDSRDERMQSIVTDGKKSAALRDELKAKEEELRNQMTESSAKLAEAQETYKEAKENLDKYPAVADVSENADYKATLEKISVLEKAIKEMSKDISSMELKAQRDILKNEIAEISGRIKAANHADTKERIATLEKEKVDMEQKAANEQKMVALAESFSKEKATMLSEKVNQMFKVVTWRLFQDQYNGGLKEICHCMVNGVDYEDVNNGHKIIAGLDIINTLSNLYEVSCPIFVDNAESINDFNVPEMNSQMIYLAVTDDKELKVESEDK